MIKIDESKKLSIDSEKRIIQIKKLLSDIDLKTIRPLRDNEIDKLKDLENQANVLREELRGLL